MVPESILRLDRWKAVPCERRSPASVFVEGGRKALAAFPALPCFQTGPATSLLKHAARRAFRGFSKAMLLRLDQDELGVLDKAPHHCDM